jgi:hypothetical protein
MQLTEDQVERTLAALREHDPRGTPVDDDVVVREERVPAEVVERLARTPAVRAAAVDRAKRRLATGTCPSPDEVARSLVGRLVCDRLR